MAEASKAVSRSLARTFIVCALGLVIVVTTLPGLSFVWDSTDAAWSPQGELGFQSDYDGYVKAVAPDSPASKAGISAGDHIDLFRTGFASRQYVSGSPSRAPAGRPVPIWVIHSGLERAVTLVAQPHDYPLFSKVTLISRTVAAFIFVIVGGLLALLRPSAVTWGFYFYCLGFSPGIAFASFSRFPSAPMHAANVIGGDLLTGAGTVGILAFALGFLCEDPAPWRAALHHALPVLVVIFAILVAYPDIANLLLGWPAELPQRIMLSLQGLVFLLSIFAIIQTYIHGAPQNRPRIQWVVVGLAFGVVINYIADLLAFSSILPFAAPRWFQSLLLVFNVTLPLTVAYAVVRHRVFELSFVVSRAIVYAVLTSLIVALFSLIEWLVGRELAAVKLARFIELGVAVGISFWVNALEKRVEKVVDGVFFRRRREAMRRLERDANAVYRANEPSTVDDYLTNEAATALSLSSAALFRRSDGSAFRRVVASGWPPGATESIDHDDKLVLTLESEWQPLRVAEIGWHHAAVPGGNQAPVLAVPLMTRQSVAAFVLYGPHANGADIDPEEVDRLNQLCKAGQTAHDELRLQMLTQQVEKLQADLARLRNGPPQVYEGPAVIADE
jgi:hypothetical protein